MNLVHCTYFDKHEGEHEAEILFGVDDAVDALRRAHVDERLQGIAHNVSVVGILGENLDQRLHPARARLLCGKRLEKDVKKRLK